MARGVFAEWLAQTGPRTSRGVAVGSQQGTQILAARAAAEIDAAHALYQTTVRGGMRKLEEGGTESSAERLTGRATSLSPASSRSRPARACSTPAAAARSI